MTHILVVDDDPAMHRAIERTLRGPGRVFTCTTRADAALEKLVTLPTRLVLCDLHMPEMSGLEFARRVRAQWPHVRCVLVTGSVATPELLEAARRGDFFRVVPKPWLRDELRNVVDAALTSCDEVMTDYPG